MNSFKVEFSDHFLRLFDEPEQTDGPLMLAAVNAGGKDGIYIKARVDRDGESIKLLIEDAWTSPGPYIPSDRIPSGGRA